MLKRKLNKKDRIILKMYVNYILKKIYFRTLKKTMLYNTFSKKKILFTNKLILETILNKKYFNETNIQKTFNIYTIH